MRKLLVLGTLLVLAVIYVMGTANQSPDSDFGATAPTDAGNHAMGMAPTRQGGSPATWASYASSVAQVLAEADLVVRARVVAGPEPRVVSFPMPILAADGSVAGEFVDKVLFSDTEMEVLETFVGSPEERITVMQTGGVYADGSEHWLDGDPLYDAGEEAVLFLAHLSPDSVHAQGRTLLFRVVNPTGRYTIQDTRALTYAESPSSSIPTTYDELVRQIRDALDGVE